MTVRRLAICGIIVSKVMGAESNAPVGWIIKKAIATDLFIQT